MKFADDTYLIIPANLTNTTQAELQHIDSWSTTNNLKLNRAKSYELIFHKRHKTTGQVVLPPTVDGINRVNELKCLGVMLSADFSVTAHIREVINSCSNSLYALRTLRSHGMCDELLQSVFKASTLSKLLYASPAWWGFTNSSDKDRLEAFLRKAARANFYVASSSFAMLCQSADHTLFKSIIENTNHVLYSSLPPKTSHGYNMRPRAHPFSFPPKRTVLDEQNFINRMLFTYK